MRIAKARCLLLMLSVLLPAAAIASSIPAAVQPPVTATRMASYFASGVQIYACSVKDGAAAWTLKAPDADLAEAAGAVVIHHFAGPTWQARDGSKVVGALLAKAPSPEAKAIPWLLLQATTSGEGRLAGTHYVVRRDTKGGVAPDGPCATGAIQSVPYSGTYGFCR